MNPPAPPRADHRVVWLLLAIFAAEFLLFDQIGSRRHTGIYPRWNDQIQYLGEAYTGYEYARQHGVGSGLWRALINPSAQGTLHDCAAIVVFAVAGPSRSAALALNMLALIAWQAALFHGVRRRSGSNALALAAAMLPVMLAGPWADVPGSAYDFRLDHLAMCALGITSAAALLTGRFSSRGWSIAFGAMVGLTLVTRFLTGTYFVVVFAALLAWTFVAADRKRRVANLALAAAVAFAIAAPIFWLNRDWVWNYYYIGHYVGPESAIRNAHMGLARSVGFVATQLGQRHLGAFFGLIALVLAAVAAWLHFRTARSNDRLAPVDAVQRDTWFCAVVFLCAPAVVLTIHQQKSEVVVSALAPGAVLLVGWLLIVFAQRVSAKALGAASFVIVLATFGFFTQRQLVRTHDAAALADIRQVNTVADYVLDRARAAKLTNPRVATDNITDCLDGQVLRVICYERHRTWTPFEMTLPTGIAEPADELVMERLAQSDFVFLGDHNAPTGPYPYDHKLAAIRPRLRVWCDQHLVVARRFVLFGRPTVLYQRRDIPRE